MSLKKILALGGGVLLIACWPLAMGQIAQSLITDTVKNKKYSQFETNLLNYERGYLNSQATTEVSVKPNSPLGQALTQAELPTRFTFEQTITHQLLGIHTVSITQDFPSQLIINSESALNGNTEFDLQLPESMELKLNASNMKFEPSVAKGSFTMQGQLDYQLTGNATIETNFGERLTLQNVQASGSGHFLEEQLWLGKHMLSSDTITLESQLQEKGQPNDIYVEQFNFQLNTALDVEQNKFNSDYHLTIASLEGIGKSVENIDVELGFLGLDAEIVAYLSQQLNSSHDQKELRVAAWTTLLQQGLTVSQPRLAFDNDQFNLQWHITVPAFEPNVNNNVYDLLDGKFNLNIAEEWLQNNNPVLKQWVDELIVMEVAVETEQGYRVSGSIKQGKIEFESGLQVPLQDIWLLGMLLSFKG